MIVDTVLIKLLVILAYLASFMFSVMRKDCRDSVSNKRQDKGERFMFLTKQKERYPTQSRILEETLLLLIPNPHLKCLHNVGR